MAQGISISYSVKYLPCNDTECTTCLMGKGHGPYWYAQYELAGELKNVFLGKEFRPLDLEKVIRKNMEQAANAGSDQSFAQSAEPIFATADYASDIFEKEPEEVAFVEENPRDANHIDRIDRKKLNTAKKNRASIGILPMPSRAEFEQDLRILRGALRHSNLKHVYRKLIKKYHPDQFQGNPIMNHWMSEINTQYNQLTRQAS